MDQKLAIIFPGQGSQSVGMLNAWQASHPATVNAACTEASNILGYDIAQLIANDADKLNQTAYTQPAMLTAGVIAWRIRQELGAQQPCILAGHSLGEYTALVCANALYFADGIKLVAKRGELMQKAVAPGTGAMAAILGLDLEQVKNICMQAKGLVQAANINAPGQIVIAGLSEFVEKAIEIAKLSGAKRAIMLPVSVPSHCDLMRPAAEEFVSYLANIHWQAPQIPVLHNYDIATHNDAASMCTVLEKQLYNPVRWVETIEYFVQNGISEIIECGPGNVLTGLTKRIAPHLGAVVC